ncbi:MAG: isoprenylcysteine carboxylmethyltransferase family protein [Hyphomonadaceae bacterium]|nr:isoprenylcysteine carboxylmethyltransferase family protein [Hyphomonadaceae bacterium]
MKLLVPPPLVFALAIFLTWATGAPFPGTQLPWPILRNIGLAVGILGGLVLLMAGAGFLARKTTVSPHRPDKTSTLVTDGVYLISRNPMYLGMALGTLAAALMLRQPVGLIWLALAMGYITWFQILPEEAALTEKFGADFEAYKKRVRRWI